jgi:hypothetical protein
MHRINLTLVNFLIFTLVSSALAFHIVNKAYEDVFASSEFIN